MGDVIAPTFPSDDWLAMSRGWEIVKQASVFNAAALTGAFQSVITVPLGEVWYVKSAMSDVVALDATLTSWAVSLGLYFVDSANYVVLAAGSQRTFNGTFSAITSPIHFAEPMLLRSGAAFASRVDYLGGGAPIAGASVITSALIARLQS